MRKLLVDRDFNTLPAEHRRPSTPRTRPTSRGCPSRSTATYMDIVENRGEGQLHAGQVELTAALEGRPRPQRRLHAGPLGQQRARHRQQQPRRRCMFDPYDIEKDRGPDPNVVKHRVVVNGTWDIPVGHGRKHGANMPGWANALFGGWTVSTHLPGAQRPQPDAVLQRLLLHEPLEHGQAAGRPRQLLLLRLAARPGQGSQHRRHRATRSSTSPPTRLPAPGQLGNAKKGSLRGPGHLGGELRVLQGRRHPRPLPPAALGPARQRLQPPAVLPGLRRAASPSSTST